MKNTTQISIILLATYLIAAFVMAEIDFRKWGWDARLFATFLAVATAFVCNTAPENTKK